MFNRSTKDCLEVFGLSINSENQSPNIYETPYQSSNSKILDIEQAYDASEKKKKKLQDNNKAKLSICDVLSGDPFKKVHEAKTKQKDQILASTIRTTFEKSLNHKE